MALGFQGLVRVKVLGEVAGANVSGLWVCVRND